MRTFKIPNRPLPPVGVGEEPDEADEIFGFVSEDRRVGLLLNSRF